MWKYKIYLSEELYLKAKIGRSFLPPVKDFVFFVTARDRI
ncbi:hypothetical protein SAMN06265377_2436 [Flagellimonas pacifica]|uniref:Uncharacterized protein n=1 Tax=Flagellimonas pacifica TaxID=1247520 RepID=A0A285MYQ0_9FLAO|nr:hypothetical protein SAMN06265377_2436 [Allomuricauda parva]